MSEDLVIEPPPGRRLGKGVGPRWIAVGLVVALLAAAITHWARHEPTLISLQTVRTAYLGGAPAETTWETSTIAARDWKSATVDSHGDCTTLTGGPVRFQASTFAVTMTSTTLTVRHEPVFAGGVGTYGYPNTEAAEEAFAVLAALVKRCDTFSMMMWTCSADSDAGVSPVGVNDRARYTLSCSGPTETIPPEAIEVFRVKNSITVLHPNAGVSDEAVRLTAAQISKALQRG